MTTLDRQRPGHEDRGEGIGLAGSRSETHSTAPPPHDTERERIILGGIALGAELPEGLTPAHFYDPLNRRTYQAATDLRAAGDSTDPYALAGAVDGLEPATVIAWEDLCPSTSALPTHARQVIEDAGRRAALVAAIDLKARASNGQPVAEFASGAITELERILHTSDDGGLLAGIRDGGWLEAHEFPPLRYTVNGLVPEGSTLLVGPPKIGKSWFVLALALAIASSGRALGSIEVDKRPVLYLALEDGDRRMKDRCRKLLSGAPIPEGFEYLTTVAPGQVVPTIAAWMRRHGDAAPLVILDTLGKVMPPAHAGESGYGRDYRIGSALKALADAHPGSSLLVNHHDRKADADDFVDAVSGTHGLAGSADTIIVLSRRRHETNGLVKVTGRDVAEGEYAVTFEAGCRWELEGSGLRSASLAAEQRRASDGLDLRSREVIAYVTDNPEGVRAADLAAALDMDGHTARTYLARMAEGGRIARLTRGLYTPVASVACVANDERNNATDATSFDSGEAA